jgi:hypothetical protein
MRFALAILLAAAAAAASPADDARAANVRGMRLYGSKKYADAAKEFRAAIAADPKFVLAHYNLASMAALLGDKPTVLAELQWLHDSSDPDARKALDKAPSDPDLHAMVDDPDVKKLIGGGCEATCDREETKCTDGCGNDLRACGRQCSWVAGDCHIACTSGMTADARARMKSWLAGPLIGNDNDAARMRAAEVSRDGYQSYSAHIKNQFGFTCALAWAADGSPGTLSSCKSDQEGWTAEPQQIPLRCRVDKKRKVDRCEGSYHLIKDGFDQDGRFALERAVR